MSTRTRADGLSTKQLVYFYDFLIEIFLFPLLQKNEL